MLKRNLSIQGVESPNFKECRRVSIAVEALLQRDPGAPEPPEEAVERLVSCGPDMNMEPELEEREVAVVLAKAVETAAANSLSAGGKAKLCEILDRHWNASRRDLRSDPPARAEPLTVTFKPKAKMVKARRRSYSLIKIAWLAICTGTFVALGLVFRKLKAVWASAAMAAPEMGGFRFVSDYHAVNKQIEKAEMVDLRRAKCFGRLDMLQGYWQMPLAAIATCQGLFTPTRVSQGVLNATAYFQGVMTELLAGLNFKGYVDVIAC